MDGDYVIAAEEEHVRLLAPLVAALRAPVRHLALRADAVPPRHWWRAQLEGAAALLRVGAPFLGPQHGLPGALLRTSDGRLVSAGWLPCEDDKLAAYAARAAREIGERGDRKAIGPIVVLAPRGERELALASDIEAGLGAPRSGVFRWTAERVTKSTLLSGLRTGCGLALYAGHGHCWGWSGYGGVAAADLAGPQAPFGAVVSLSCDTAWRASAISFCEEIVLSGFALASVGAVGKTLNSRNRELAMLMAGALRESDIFSIGALCAAVAGRGGLRLLAHYRICGDPLSRLVGSEDADHRAAQIVAPAATDPPPPLDPELWYGDGRNRIDNLSKARI